MTGSSIRRLRASVVLAASMLALVAMTLPARAFEGKGDLNVQLRLVEPPGQVKTGSSTSGLARIEVVVDAFYATHDIKLSVEKPDGRAWTFQTRPFLTSNLVWTDPGGEPLEPDAHGPSVPARGAIRTAISVPLEGAALHQVIVRVLGTVNGDPVGTEGAILVPLGVPPQFTVDDEGVANFSMKGVQ